MINSVDNEGQTKLHVAAALGDIMKAAQLIKGITFLILCTISNCKDGIELNVQDKNGWSALHCAAYSRHKNVLDLLLSQDGIDVRISQLQKLMSLGKTEK